MNAPTNVNTPMPSPRTLAGWVRTLGWWTNTVPNKAGSMTDSPSRVGIYASCPSPGRAQQAPPRHGFLVGFRSGQRESLRDRFPLVALLLHVATLPPHII